MNSRAVLTGNAVSLAWVDWKYSVSHILNYVEIQCLSREFARHGTWMSHVNAFIYIHIHIYIYRYRYRYRYIYMMAHSKLYARGWLELYIDVCVCVFIDVYVCIYVCQCVRSYTHVCVCRSMYMCTYIYVKVWGPDWKYSTIYIYICTCVCVCRCM